MGTPDLWVKLVKEQRDENWSMSNLVSSLCNRRRSERTVGYVESHDQSLVGDQTLGAALARLISFSGSVRHLTLRAIVCPHDRIIPMILP